MEQENSLNAIHYSVYANNLQQTKQKAGHKNTMEYNNGRATRQRRLYQHPPMLSVAIDFVKAGLVVKAQASYLSTIRRQKDAVPLITPEDGITVHANFSSTVNISDYFDYDLGLPFEGNITAGSNVSPTSGILIIDMPNRNPGVRNKYWTMALYFYDQSFDNYEVKFQIATPMPRSNYAYN